MTDHQVVKEWESFQKDSHSTYIEVMNDRRQFLKLSALGSAALFSAGACHTESTAEEINSKAESSAQNAAPAQPIVISTWDHGMAANAAAWEILGQKGNALDAVEAGVRVTESDPENQSVGLGGLPDREGKVTLDACIMNHKNECGAVAFLEHIENPISVARKVMEETPHVMLVGEGALQFALEQGFPKKNLLTPASEAKWKKWLETSDYQTIINRENHDTIGLLALDAQGNLSGACTTSGMSFKMRGRVGDSPIIGAGLFVDNEVGAACATGVGEAIIRVAGSAIVVELMRHGRTPQQACEEVVDRIRKKHPSVENLQVGFIALNKQGEYGAHCVYEGFNYALRTDKENRMVMAEYEFKETKEEEERLEDLRSQ